MGHLILANRKKTANRPNQDRACCSLEDIPCSMLLRWTTTHPQQTRTHQCQNGSRGLRRSSPRFQVFAENMSYYSTLAHEHGHWTANAARCDRQLGKRFGNSAYAAEELIAELGAAFTCAHLGGLARHSGWEFVPGEQRGESRFVGLIRHSSGPPYICLRPRTTA